ncbi:MAG: SAM-dependent methyltransferase [Rhodobacteraceae bacterium]|nr:SAM-dependent methyltransferase [Paracoccaceae bacterium]
MAHDPADSRPRYAEPVSGPDGGAGDARLTAPAASRNSADIAAALARLLADERGPVMEIGAGTGQHALACARALPRLTWIPTDPDPLHVASIEAWRAAEGPENLASPLSVNADAGSGADWAAAARLTHGPLRAVFCANVIHIAPWSVAEGLVAGAAAALGAGGRLILYGPFYEEGEAVRSNRDFDEMLRGRDPAWGVRNLEDVAALASDHGFGAPRRVEMPANNLILAFPR